MQKLIEVIIESQYNKFICRCVVDYYIIPGESEYYNSCNELISPAIADEIEINDLKVMKVITVDYIINRNWFLRHPNWQNWLSNKCWNLIEDYDNQYCQELLDVL